MMMMMIIIIIIIIKNQTTQTSILTASTLSMCLLKICLRTKSGPRNFFPLKGQSHLSLANSCVFASTNFSVSLNMVKQITVEGKKIKKQGRVNSAQALRIITKSLIFEKGFFWGGGGVNKTNETLAKNPIYTGNNGKILFATNNFENERSVAKTLSNT